MLLARMKLGPHLKRRYDASDLVQQTLLKAHRDEAQFRGSTSAEKAGWLNRGEDGLKRNRERAECEDKLRNLGHKIPWED